MGVRGMMPAHLLSIIFDRLGFAEFIRAGAVCRWWRESMSFSQGEWSGYRLLLVDRDQDTRVAVSLTEEGRCYRLRLPQIRDLHCAGSAGGWLILLGSAGDPLAFNPVTGATFDQIPGITGLPCTVGNRYRGRRRLFYFRSSGGNRYSVDARDVNLVVFNRFVVYLEPQSQSIVAVAATVMNSSGLVLWMAGEVAWTNLVKLPPSDSYVRIDDALFRKGCLYTVNEFGTITVHNLTTMHVRTLEGTTIAEEVEGDGGNDFGKMYLVELEGHSHGHGELLMVWRQRRAVRSYIVTHKMRVYRLVEEEEDDGRHSHWEEVTSSSLLDRIIIFIGHNQGVSISVPADHHPQLKQNCIYFTDDYYFNMLPKNRMPFLDMGIYSLQERRVIHHCHHPHPDPNQAPQGWPRPLPLLNRWPAPVWFTPFIHQPPIA